MKTLLITENNTVVGVEPETLKVFNLQSSREAISRIFKMEEDCKIQYNDITEEAKAGQLLIVFYEGIFPNKFVLVSSDKWIENIDTYNKKMDEHRKGKEVEVCSGDCEVCCDQCSPVFE